MEGQKHSKQTADKLELVIEKLLAESEVQVLKLKAELARKKAFPGTSTLLDITRLKAELRGEEAHQAFLREELVRQQAKTAAEREKVEGIFTKFFGSVEAGADEVIKEAKAKEPPTRSLN